MLTKVQLKNIENMATDLLLEVYGSDISVREIIPPVDVNQIIHFLGIKLAVADFGNSFTLSKYNSVTNTISIPNSDNIAQIRFALAHEIGHISLHGSNIQDCVPFDSNQAAHLFNDLSVKDQEANWFAASLLMPNPTMKSLFTIYGKAIEPVAKAFGVNTSVAYYRAQILGYIT